MAKKAKTSPKKLSDEQLAFVKEQTQKLARDLAFYARGPVRVQLVEMAGVAYTYGCDDKDHAVPVVMNPNILLKVRNQERAASIWRGIGFHELAHHLWPAEKQYKAANKEGFQSLFNLVDDEQNERRGRAKDPTWGAHFQSVCAYIFPSKKRRREDILGLGIIDDGKEAKPSSAPGEYAKRWNEFAFHFRRHLPTDAKTNPLVVEALELIPRRFMDLTKEDLLDLTRKIHEVLARGIDLPKPQTPEKKTPKPGQNEEPDEDQDEEEEAQPDTGPDEEEAGPSGPPWWKKLFASKWAWLGLGLFAAIWLVVFLWQGVDFWKMLLSVVVFWSLVVIGFTGLIIWMRRQRRKALAAVLKRAPPTATGPPGTTAPATGRVWFASSYVLSLIAWSAMMFAAYLIAGGVASLIWPIVLLVLAVLSVFGAQALRRHGQYVANLGKTGTSAPVTPAQPETFTGRALWVLSFAWIPHLFSWLGQWLGRGFRLLSKGLGKGFRLLGWALRRFVWRPLVAVWMFVATVFSVVYGFVSTRISKMWRSNAARWLRIATSVAGVWLLRMMLRFWRSAILRLAILAIPVAALLCLVVAAATNAIEMTWWQILLLILALLCLLLFGWFFRKKLKDFLVAELLADQDLMHEVMCQLPIDKEMLEFNVLHNIQPVQADPDFIEANLPDLRALAQELRKSLVRCGSVPVDKDDRPDGHDLIDELENIVMGDPEIFVDEEIEPKCSLHIEVAVDCSSSMDSQTARLKRGQKFQLAKRFALLVEEAAKGQKGISGHVWGFTDRALYDCGTLGEGRVSGLVNGGGNNDAAALWQMGRSAAGSNRDMKILLMISDGQPSECTWGALHHLGWQLTVDGMLVVQIAVDHIQDPALPWLFVDLHGQEMSEAIITFTRLLSRLVER